MDELKELKGILNKAHGPTAFDNIRADLKGLLKREPNKVEMAAFIMGHINVMDGNSHFNKNYGTRELSVKESIEQDNRAIETAEALQEETT